MEEDTVSQGISSAVSGVRDGWAVGPGAFIKADQREYGFRCGFITTPHGVVGFYDQVERHRQSPHTSFDFATGGRTYRITWPRTFSDRFLKTLAKRFAAECSDAR